MALDELVFNHRNFEIKLPKQLKNIYNAIEKSKSILDLKDNYDCEGSKAPSLKIWKNSIEFLAQYSKFVYERDKVIIKAPSIYHGIDNSIDILFGNKDKTRMLINICEENREIIASYYGDNYNGIKPKTKEEKKSEIEGKIQTNKIHRPLANWMKKYLRT